MHNLHKSHAGLKEASSHERMSEISEISEQDENLSSYKQLTHHQVQALKEKLNDVSLESFLLMVLL